MKLHFLLAIILIIPVTFAYQPRLAVSGNGTETSPFVIDNPVVSQIFYGELHGSPVYYKFKSDKPFSLFTQILVPYAQGYDANGHKISVYVATENRREVAFIYEDTYFWSTVSDEVNGDYYFAGPPIRRNLTAGTYVIRLFNTGNSGRYALAIGEQESGNFLDMLMAFPFVRQQIFGGHPLENFLHLAGVMIIAGCASALLVSGLVTKKTKESIFLIESFDMVKYVMWVGFLLALYGWFSVYLQNTSHIFRTAGTVVIILMLLHWILYFFTSNGKIATAKQKNAKFRQKFLSRIVRGMAVQLVLLILLFIAHAVIQS